MPFDEEESNSVATSSFLSPVIGVREEFRVRVRVELIQIGVRDEFRVRFRVEVLSNGVLWMNLGLVLGLSYFQIGVKDDYRLGLGLS